MYSNGKQILLNVAFAAIILGAVLVKAQNNPPTDEDCVDDAPFPDPANCTAHYQCFFIGGQWTLVHLDCPAGGHYNPAEQACVLGPCEDPTTTTELATETTTAESTTIITSGPTTEVLTTKSEVETTTDPQKPSPFKCTTAGFFPHPTDPRKYIRCISIWDKFLFYYLHVCPLFACYQPDRKVCVKNSCPRPTTPTTTLAPPATTVTVPPPTTTVTVAPPTTPAPPVIKCNLFSAYPYENTCNRYYHCIQIGYAYINYVFYCLPGMYFDRDKGRCVLGTCPYDSPTTAATTFPSNPNATTIAPTTTAAPPAPVICDLVSAYPYEGCNRFFHCIQIGYAYVNYVFNCLPGMYFDRDLGRCIPGTCPYDTVTTVATTIFADPTATTITTTPAAPPPSVVCDLATSYPYEDTCNRFYNCIQIGYAYINYVFYCLPNMYFNREQGGCVIGTCPYNSTTAIATTPPPFVTPTSSSEMEDTSNLPDRPRPFTCEKQGIFTDPSNCASYNRCILIFGELYYFKYTCPPFMHFDLTFGLCVLGPCGK